MPRQRKLAERIDAPPPQRASGAKTEQPEMMTRRRVIRELMLESASVDKCLVVMQSKWPEVTESVVRRMIAEAERELTERATEKLALKKMKQEARLLGHISKAAGKSAFSAVSSLEKTYADVAGTNAPIRVRHEVSYTTRFEEALKRAAALLSENQARGFLNGHTVPLGLSGSASVIEVSGEGKDE